MCMLNSLPKGFIPTPNREHFTRQNKCDSKSERLSWDSYETLSEKYKMLVASIFFFFHNVFKRFSLMVVKSLDYVLKA